MFKRTKVTMPVISPVHIANSFLKYEIQENIEITPLKMQKLIYFLYREYLQTTQTLLFSEQFETWKHGPALPSIYAKFGSYENKPIETFANDAKGFCYTVHGDKTFKKCIRKIWNQYKYYARDMLSDITCKNGTAWSLAMKNNSPRLNINDIMNETESTLI